MTVSSSTNRASYSGNGSLTTFAYSFKVFDQDDLTVILRASNGTETVQTITTDYTVTGVGDVGGGNVVFGTAPASGVTVVILREMDLEQGLDLVPNDPFPAQSLENSLDKLTFMVQQHNEELGRTIKASRTNVISGSEFTISAADRANKIFAFDSSGDVSITQEIGTFRGDWATATAYEVRDIVKDTSTNNIFLVNAAHTSSGAQPLTTNANSAKYDLLVDAAAATASAAAAASSATDAETAQTASEAAQAAAEAAQAAAETAETNAETAETNAETAQTAAEAAQAAAELVYDNFDDRYLGAKSTNNGDPTLDNDGDALIDGALFFDTTNNVMKVYNLTTNWLRTTPTTSDQTNINTVSGIQANVTTVAGISTDVTTVSGISSNVTSVAGNETNINTVAADGTDIGLVADDITNVNTVATNIASVNTNAANITDIQNASANAATATTQAGIATTKASEASASEIAAEAAKVAAEAALDEFTDIYLGAKASDPTTDNDGNALTAGDQYFNTTLNVLKIYNGSAWQAAAIDSSGFVETTGDTMTGNLSFGDNDKAIFGAGSDLQIFHTGSYSAIRDVGTGGLFIGGENYVDIGNAGASATYARFHKDAQVDLYHNNSVKLATSASGIDISGTVTADGLTVDGTSILDSETNFVPDTYSSNKSLVLSSQGATGGNGQLGASVAFSRINTESPRAAIAAINTDSNFERMGLSFWTHQDNFANVMKKRMQIDHEGDISFYEDTGTTAKLTWDASAQSLSVDGPITADGLAVHGDGTFSATTDVSFTLKSTSGALSQGQVLGKINFFNSDPSSFGPNNAAVIEAIAFGVSGNAAELNFRTNNSITEGADAAKTMSLNAFGDISFYDSTGTTPKFFWDASAESLGIGESSPASYGKLTLLDGATRFWITESTSNEMMLSVGASERMLFGINNTEAMRIDSSGHAIIPAGVTLGTAAGVYAAANTLDDYEEGTWTPVLGGSSGTSGQTYAKQVGLYTKIGNTVHAQCYVQLSAEGTVSGSLILDGLPFASANVTDAYGAGCISQFVNLGSNVVDMSLRTNVNASYAFVFGLAAAATGSGALSAPTYLTNSTIIAASLTYKAA